jgi:hypothetical protein
MVQLPRSDPTCRPPARSQTGKDTDGDQIAPRPIDHHPIDYHPRSTPAPQTSPTLRELRRPRRRRPTDTRSPRQPRSRRRRHHRQPPVAMQPMPRRQDQSRTASRPRPRTRTTRLPIAALPRPGSAPRKDAVMQSLLYDGHRCSRRGGGLPLAACPQRNPIALQHLRARSSGFFAATQACWLMGSFAPQGVASDE